MILEVAIQAKSESICVPLVSVSIGNVTVFSSRKGREIHNPFWWLEHLVEQGYPLLPHRVGSPHGNGGMQYGNGSMQYGNGSMQYGNGGMQYGNGGIQYGNGGIQYGNGGMQYGNGGMQYGNMDLATWERGPVVFCA